MNEVEVRYKRNLTIFMCVMGLSGLDGNLKQVKRKTSVMIIGSKLQTGYFFKDKCFLLIYK